MSYPTSENVFHAQRKDHTTTRMMKRLFSSKKTSNTHSGHAAPRPGRPSSPPPDIYAGYVDNNTAAPGSNFFSSTVALPSQYQPPPVSGASVSNGHAPQGAYLNSNGVTAGNGGSPGHHYGSSASSMNGNHAYTTGSYLNSVPAASVNGDDASTYGGSTLGHTSSVGDAGFNNIPLPPSAPVNAGAGTTQYPPASMGKYNAGFNGSSAPFAPRQPPPPANMQPIQHQALPTPTRKPIHPASSGLQAVHEQRVVVPQNQRQQQRGVVHTKVTAEDIRETTYMLRQLYKMELQIYGERYAIHRDDKTRREEMRRKADLLREEIEDIVHTWSITDSAGWTSEELQHVQYSLNIISNLRTMGQEAEV